MTTRETQKARLIVGLFVLGGLGVFAFLVFKLGGASLRPRIHGSALFDDVSGLVAGANVTVAGVPVGQVRSLSPERGRARVAFVLYEGHGLTHGAQAEIRARSLLGEKYLALTAAAAAGPPLADGFELPALPSPPSPDELMARLARLVDAIPMEALAEDLRRVDAFLQTALPRLDEALAGADLKEIAATARAVREAVEAERPGLHRAVTAVADVAEAYRPGAPGAAEDLQASLQNLRAVSERLAELDGTELEADGKAMRDALRRLPATLDKLDRTLDALARLGPLLERLEKMNEAELRKFLQDEGVRIRFTSPD